MSQGTQVQQGKPPVTPQQQAFLNLVTQASEPNNQAGIQQAQQQYVQTVKTPIAGGVSSGAGTGGANPTPTPAPTSTIPTQPPQNTNVFAIIGGALGTVEKTVVGGASTIVNDASTIVNGIGGGGALVSPTGKGTTFVNLTPNQILNRYNSPAFQKIVLPTVEAAAVISAAVVAPEIVIPSVIIGEGANIGVNSILATKPVTTTLEVSGPTGSTKTVTTNYKWSPHLVLPTSPQQVIGVAAYSAVFGLVGAGTIGAVGKVAPSVAGNIFARIGINAGLGAGASALGSGGNPTAIAEGAGFGAGFGALGEGVSAIGNTDLFQSAKEQVVGAKFTELTGAKELVSQSTVGEETTIKQITEPTTETVTLRGKDISFYRTNNLSTLRNPVIDFAGTEKVYTPDPVLGGKEVEPIPELKQVESTRTANPVLAALTREGDYKLAIIKTGDASDFVKTPSDYPAIQKTKVTIDLEKNQPPAVFSEKTVITSQETILPEAKISFRDFTGVQIRGTPDEANVADVAKALPEPLANQIYKQLGGNYRPMVDYGSQAPEDLSGAMPKGSNVFFKEAAGVEGTKGIMNAENNPVTGDKAPSGIAETAQVHVESKEVTLPRAIVGEASQTQGYKFAGTPTLFVSTRGHALEEETAPLSYPTGKLGHPTILGAPTVTSQRGKAKATVGFALIPTAKQNPRQPQGQSLVPTQKPQQKQTITPNVILGQGQGQPQVTRTPQTIKQTQTTSTAQTTPYPDATFKKSSFNMPPLMFSGGGVGQGKNLSSGRGGRFYEVKNPIPTPKTVVGRFITTTPKSSLGRSQAHTKGNLFKSSSKNKKSQRRRRLI